MKFTTLIQIDLNKAMKAEGRHHQWKVSVIGSFLAIKASADTSMSDAWAARKYIEVNYPTLIDLKRMAPAMSLSIDGTSLINWSLS